MYPVRHYTAHATEISARGKEAPPRALSRPPARWRSGGDFGKKEQDPHAHNAIDFDVQDNV